LYKKDLLPAELINNASRKDPKALKTLDLFFEIFAKFLAEISLVYMPGSGIFISGSLMRNLDKLINKKKFNKNYVEHVEKSHKKVLESFEISLIKQEHLSVYGCKEFFNLTQKDLN
jgi:glucokinase